MTEIELYLLVPLAKCLPLLGPEPVAGSAVQVSATWRWEQLLDLSPASWDLR